MFASLSLRNVARFGWLVAGNSPPATRDPLPAAAAICNASSITAEEITFSSIAERFDHSAIPTDTNTANPRIPHVVID
jgi:hypothetical protein